LLFKIGIICSWIRFDVLNTRYIKMKTKLRIQNKTQHQCLYQDQLHGTWYIQCVKCHSTGPDWVDCFCVNHSLVFWSGLQNLICSLFLVSSCVGQIGNRPNVFNPTSFRIDRLFDELVDEKETQSTIEKCLHFVLLME